MISISIAYHYDYFMFDCHVVLKECRRRVIFHFFVYEKEIVDV